MYHLLCASPGSVVAITKCSYNWGGGERRKRENALFESQAVSLPVLDCLTGFIRSLSTSSCQSSAGLYQMSARRGEESLGPGGGKERKRESVDLVEAGIKETLW